MTQIKKAVSQNIPRSSPALRQEVHSHYSRLVFDRQEDGRLHNPYEDEVRRLEAIAAGDLDTLETFWTYDYGEAYGRLARDSLRNIKNLCIGNVVLASRAAIRGGAPVEVIFSLVDVYVQKLEEYYDAADVVKLSHSAEVDFTQRVPKASNASAAESVRIQTHIDNCKSFIYAHMHEKLTVQQVAEGLYLNPNYLSTIFRRSEGKTILRYILEEKVKTAQNMLVCSEYSHSEIASYLGFSGQSHLGSHFKRFCGMTMGEYRAKYRNPLF